MHYGNLVIVSKGDDPDSFDLDSAVEQAMGPSEDNGGFWDWYQIGGRWTGVLDGYDPETDEANIKTCSLCGGTGKRTDMEVADGCDGCGGKGRRAEWPTQWKRHDGDVMPVSKLTQEQLDKFYRVVCPDGYGVHGGERYLPWKPSGEMFVEMEKPPLEWLLKEFGKPEYLAVVVDNHS